MMLFNNFLEFLDAPKEKKDRPIASDVFNFDKYLKYQPEGSLLMVEVHKTMVIIIYFVQTISDVHKFHRRKLRNGLYS